MKKLYFFVLLFTIIISFSSGQTVSNYSYRLDNGINVTTEKTWMHIKTEFNYDTTGYKDNPIPLNVIINPAGELSSGSLYKVFRDGLEVSDKAPAPGTYSLKVILNLSATAGNITFDIGNIVVKPKTKTTVTVYVYEYLVSVAETPANQKGLSYYQSKINRFKGNDQQNLNWGLPSFYLPGKHDKKINPDEAMGDYYGRIKPGIYDVLISMEISGKKQKIWLNNFTLKPDKKYNITINLNAGQLTYTGGKYEVKALYLYPSGTSDKQPGKPVRNPALEIQGYEPATQLFAAPPGTYDILLNFGSGVKYEWRKTTSILTGQTTSVK